MNRINVWAGLALIAVLVACGSGRPAGGAIPAGQAPGPALTVERFLQAANANDLITMMGLFGTAENTIAELDGRTMAERRMFVLASLLRHDDFVIRSQESMPGRLFDAAIVQVRLQQGEATVQVPFTVVRRDSGGWIVEQIDVEPLTAPG